MSSLNTLEFGHLIQYLLYILQYILQKYPKTCGHFCCGQSSDNIFWTPHNLKYMAHMQNPDCKTFYVSRNSSSCVWLYYRIVNQGTYEVNQNISETLQYISKKYNHKIYIEL